MVKPCDQSESPPRRSQLHSQGYFTIAETAEDGQTAGCSRRNVIRGNNNITKEVGLIVKYAGHKLIIRRQQYNQCRNTQYCLTCNYQSIVNTSSPCRSSAPNIEISVAGLAIVAIPVIVNAVRVLGMYTSNTMYSIRRIEYIVLIFFK